MWFGSILCHDVNDVELSIEFGECGITFVIVRINEKDNAVSSAVV